MSLRIQTRRLAELRAFAWAAALSTTIVVRGGAQTPVTRAQAVEAAVARGARLAIAAADTAAAAAQLVTARALENPTLTTEYSKSAPRYHVLLDVPVDYPWLRRARVGSAAAGRRSARLRFASERALTALDADTTYTHALAARAHYRLSLRDAVDADSLLRMAIARRDAGDAADIDVELARVAAGQQLNTAAADSLEYEGQLLDLQAAMGMQAGRVEIVVADSLGPLSAADTATRSDLAPPSPAVVATRGGVTTDSGVATGEPLTVAAASASVESARLATELQRRSVWPAPTLTAGIETGDPRGDEPGILPVIGVGLPLPLFSRNQGPIAQARAELARAEAELTQARIESRTAIAHARRELAVAAAKVRRDSILVVSADRVASMSLTAYREGASTLPNVLEARRSAREVFATYVDDLAQAWIAAATLRYLTITSTASAPR